MRKLSWALGAAILALSLLGVWCVRRSLSTRLSAGAIERRARSLLKAECHVDLAGSWRLGRAAGGSADARLLSPRPRNEWFIEEEGDHGALASLCATLAARREGSDFYFFPLDDTRKLIMPHRYSTNVAAWWQPETNPPPMMSSHMVCGRLTAYIYGFRVATNAQLYIHIIER